MALAQTLDQAVTGLLENQCEELNGEPRFTQRIPGLGEDLSNICFAEFPGAGGGAGSGTASAAGGGAAASPTAVSVLQRRFLERREEALEAEVEFDESGGASADAEADLGAGINVWLSGRYEDLDKEVTAFEDGYDSDVWGFTAGADFLLTNWLVAGFAFDWSGWNGDYTGGDEFRVNTFGPIIYASVFPLDNLFLDASFGFSKSRFDRSRFTSFTDEDDETFSGLTEADYDGDRIEVNVLTGYDYSIANFTIGPRFGFRYEELDIDAYTERGDSGLELSYDDQVIRSMQTKVGFQASTAIGMGFGVLVPQFNFDWTHEYENDQRFVVVRFAQDLRDEPTRFGFQTDSPDRNFFHIGGGVVAVLPRGIQAFANLEAMLANRIFDDLTGTFGFRLEL